MTANRDRALNVSMFAPWHERCGIRDYTVFLAAALDSLDGIGSIRVVDAPPHAARSGLEEILKHRSEDQRRFKQAGDAMNSMADIAHVQHQYFLFGGVAPYRTHITAFLNQIKIPVVVTVHEIADEDEGWLNRLAVRAANRMNFGHRAIKALIVHTDADRKKLVRMDLPEQRIHVIRHSMPPALPLPAPAIARRALERTYPALAGRRAVTLFGFLSNKKGHRIALAALSRLPDDIALIFAGDQHPDDHTDYVPSLRSEIERLGLRERVVITGYLPEEQVPEIMAITEVALAPFLRTSGSGSLANLLAYGRAVVASDIEPHRELLAAEPGILTLVPTENPESLAAEMSALLNSPTRREILQQAALAYAARNTYATLARQTLEVYYKILEPS